MTETKCDRKRWRILLIIEELGKADLEHRTKALRLLVGKPAEDFHTRHILFVFNYLERANQR